MTVAVTINADGANIPPLIVPLALLGQKAQSEWMQEAEFLLFLEHFKKEVKSTIDQNCLLLLDNHVSQLSHISIKALFFFGAEEERSVMVISEIVGTTSSLPDLTDFQTLTLFFALVNVSWHKFILLQSYRGKML